MAKYLRNLLVLIAAVPLVSPAAIPPKLEVRLQNHLTSYSSPLGSHFRCVVIRSYEVNGRVLIPKGSIVFGTVSKEQRVGIGLIHERAALELKFEEYETPDGRRLPLSATLASIDNAREQVSPTGRIKGVLAANNPGNLLNGLWSRPSLNLMYRALSGLTGASNQVWLKYSMGPAGVAGLFAIRCLILPFPEPEIHLPPGTDMELAVKLPLAENSQDVSVPALPAIQGLSKWLKDKLDLVSYANGQPAPDLINIVLLGSSRNVSLSFAASGWSKADPRSVIASSHMYEAFSLMQNYATAPVSKLYYRGVEPDLVFEKSLNTITQRHHIRLWKAGIFDGNEVWLGAATHDTGVKFRFSSVTFTHKIDRNIDVEREKVSTDLTFAGCGTASSLHMPANLSANQDERVTTDGQITVLAVQPCIAENDSEHSPKPPGTRLTRLTRRVVLEARNYILRDNTYYWTYRMIRSRSLW